MGGAPTIGWRAAATFPGMRASGALSLLLVLASGAGLVACGGDDESSPADGERLTRAEYDLVERHYDESKKALADADESLAALERNVAMVKRQCGELRASGAVLRGSAAGCDGYVASLDAFVAFGSGSAECGDDDQACIDRELEKLVGAFENATNGYATTRAALEEADVSEACREVLLGSEADVDAFRAARDAGREMLAAGKALEQDPENADAAKRLEVASGRFETALGTFEDLDTALPRPTPCRADVAD